MSQDSPALQDSAGVLVQRGVGRVGRNVVPLVIGIAGVTVAAVLGAGQGRYGPFTLVAGAFGAFGLFFGLFPIVVWHGVQVRIDDSGVLFGSARPLRRPPVPFSALRQPYFAPWGALADVHVIDGRAAARAMRTSVAPMVTRYNGFFPRAGASPSVLHGGCAPGHPAVATHLHLGGVDHQKPSHADESQHCLGFPHP